MWRQESLSLTFPLFSISIKKNKFPLKQKWCSLGSITSRKTIKLFDNPRRESRSDNNKNQYFRHLGCNQWRQCLHYLLLLLYTGETQNIYFSENSSWKLDFHKYRTLCLLVTGWTWEKSHPIPYIVSRLNMKT